MLTVTSVVCPATRDASTSTSRWIARRRRHGGRRVDADDAHAGRGRVDRADRRDRHRVRHGRPLRRPPASPLRRIAIADHDRRGRIRRQLRDDVVRCRQIASQALADAVGRRRSRSAGDEGKRAPGTRRTARSPDRSTPPTAIANATSRSSASSSARACDGIRERAAERRARSTATRAAHRPAPAALRTRPPPTPPPAPPIASACSAASAARCSSVAAGPQRRGRRDRCGSLLRQAQAHGSG